LLLEAEDEMAALNAGTVADIEAAVSIYNMRPIFLPATQMNSSNQPANISKFPKRLIIT